jgi:hypothetical protein
MLLKNLIIFLFFLFKIIFFIFLNRFNIKIKKYYFNIFIKNILNYKHF